MKNYEFERDLVSIVIPTYKRSDMLFRAIDSVLNQTYSKIEILVVNDNVKGDSFSLELIKKMKKYENDLRVVLVEQDEHINGAVARNVGIKKAKGEFLAFLDDDDWWEPQKLEHQIAYLSKLDESWGGVSCLMRHYKNDKLVYVSLPYKEGYLMQEVITRHIGIGTGSPLMRRAAVEDAGLFDEKLLRHQDIQFFALFCSKYKMGLLKEYLYNYDLGDSQNRPSPDKILNIKKQFYISIDSLIQEMTKSKRKQFFIMNNFEIGCAYFKAKNYKKAIPLLMKVFCYPTTLYMAIDRVVVRWKGKKFASYYERKFRLDK